MNKIVSVCIVVSMVLITLIVNNLADVKTQSTERISHGEVNTSHIFKKIRVSIEWSGAYIYHLQYQYNTRPDQEKVDKIEEWLELKYPASPIRGNVQMMVDMVGIDKTIRALAIARQESGMGLTGYIAADCYNYFGYKYGGTSLEGCYSKHWTSPETGISRYLYVVQNSDHTNWLTTSDLSGYCGSDCNDWMIDVPMFEAELRAL